MDDEVGAGGAGFGERGGEVEFGGGEGLGGVVDEENEVGVGESFVGAGDSEELGRVDGWVRTVCVVPRG